MACSVSRQHVVVIREPSYGDSAQWSRLAVFLTVLHFSTRHPSTSDWIRRRPEKAVRTPKDQDSVGQASRRYRELLVEAP
jgi:hypothetical protein